MSTCHARACPSSASITVQRLGGRSQLRGIAGLAELGKLCANAICEQCQPRRTRMRPSVDSSARYIFSAIGATSFLMEPSTNRKGLFCGHHFTTWSPQADKNIIDRNGVVSIGEDPKAAKATRRGGRQAHLPRCQVVHCAVQRRLNLRAICRKGDQRLGYRKWVC